jgi:hypothetical protein
MAPRNSPYPSSYELHTDNLGAVCFGLFESAKACAVFPQSRYAGTNFAYASFEELEIDKATTERACLTPPMRAANVPEFDVPKRDPKRIINGVRFLHGISIGVGGGTAVTTDVYRAFHKGKCYELSVNIASSNIAYSDPGTVKEFTREDEKKVRSEIMAILDSFRFLK